MPGTLKKLRLHGFNNLIKTLSFNIYDVCYAESAQQREAYIHYIDDAYNAERLTGILTESPTSLGPPSSTSPARTTTPRGPR